MPKRYTTKDLTQSRLKEFLHYDPETGVFTWLASKGKGVKAGQIARCPVTRGYKAIRIDGKLYRTSRLAWLYMEGYFPEKDIDHGNRIRHDDRWKNLRHVSHSCNMRNKSIYRNNSSGITGVSWDNQHKKWRVEIMTSGKSIFLGRFTSKLDAAKARWEAEIKYGFTNCNTTSTAYLYLKSHNALN